MLYKRRATANVSWFNGSVYEVAPMDVMWLYQNNAPGGSEPDEPYLVRKAFPDEIYSESDGVILSVVLVNYSVPRGGTWDTDSYTNPFSTSSIAVSFGALGSKSEVVQNTRPLENITVALLPNDPRLEELYKYLGYEDHSDFGANHTSRRRLGEVSKFVGAMDCNVMAGYTGRLCSKCLPGFSGMPCKRCPPYDICVVSVLGGFVTAFIIVLGMILVVVAHAGTTSTSTVTKRLIVTHAQTIALLINFDLNWNTNLLSFFSITGSFSSIGEDLIKTGCILGAHDRDKLAAAPFYLNQLLFLLLPILFMIPGTIYLLLHHRPCMQKSREKLAQMRKDNRETLHYVKVIQTIKLKKMKKEMEESKSKREAKAKLKRWNTVRNKKFSKKDHRNEFHHLIHKLQQAAAEDQQYGIESEVDHLAIGRLKARELVDLVETHSINLRSLFREYNYSETQHLDQGTNKEGENKRMKGETGDDENLKIKLKKDQNQSDGTTKHHTGCVAAADFLIILKSMHLGWTQEEYMDIIELLSQPGKKVTDEKGHSKRLEPRITIKHLLTFETHFSDRLIVMATVISFILYPTIVKNIFLSLSCRHGLMDGDAEWYLNEDLDIPCTSSGHVAYIVTVCLPCLIGYVIGYPFIVLWNIWRSRRKHGRLSEKASFRYAVFVSGYRASRWFWEGVTCLRKVLLSLIAVFLGSFGPERQFFFASLLLVVTLVSQLHMKPFENGQLNALETSGIGFLWLTLYFGIFFYWQLLVDTELDVLGIFVVMINVGYLMWAFGYMFAEYLTFFPEGRKILGRFGSKSTNPFFLAVTAVPGCVVLICLHLLKGCKIIKEQVHVLAHMRGDSVSESELVDPEAELISMVKEMKAALGTHHTELQNNHEYKLEMQRMMQRKRQKEQEALLSAKRLALQKKQAEELEKQNLRKKKEKEARFKENIMSMFNYGDSSSDEDQYNPSRLDLDDMFMFESSDSESESFDLSMDILQLNNGKSEAHIQLEEEFERHKMESEQRSKAREDEMMAKIAELEAKLANTERKQAALPKLQNSEHKADLGFGNIDADAGGEEVEDSEHKADLGFGNIDADDKVLDLGENSNKSGEGHVVAPPPPLSEVHDKDSKSAKDEGGLDLDNLDSSSDEEHDKGGLDLDNNVDSHKSGGGHDLESLLAGSDGKHPEPVEHGGGGLDLGALLASSDSESESD